ncbi:MAG TPA: class I SAM-dependent methyltransferase [Candidatus Nanopelagicales bacterium]|jgi:SAM-dependent methyltransferase
MPLGSSVRGLLGRYEPAAIRLYRGRFIDLDALAATIASVAPDSMRVLEIGCGDGAMMESLQRQLPATSMLGIDPGVPTPGRMFDGDRTRVTFEESLTSDLIARGEPPFDLVLLVDVLHHVADVDRQTVLDDAATLTAPGGTLIVKEWEAGKGLGNRLAFVADRYVSGDVTVRFMRRDEMQALVDNAVPGWQRTCEARIPPRRANLLLSYRRSVD